MAIYHSGSPLGTAIETAELADSAVTNAKVSASAAIAKSKIATASTWVLADLPSGITQSDKGKVTTAFTTSSTTYVDVTGFSITLTTGANPVLVLFSANCDGTTSTATLNILEDATERAYANYAGFANAIQIAMHVLTTVTAASHTWKIQAKVNANSTTIATTSAPQTASGDLTVIELVK